MNLKRLIILLLTFFSINSLSANHHFCPIQIDSGNVKTEVGGAKKKLGAAEKKAKGFKKVFKLFSSFLKKKKHKKTSPTNVQAKAVHKDSSTVSSRVGMFSNIAKMGVHVAEEWDSIHQIQDHIYVSESDTVRKEVFGFHPYWMGTAYESYDYDLLTAVAYFSFELNPSSGEFKSTHDWATTSLIDSVHKHHCRLYFTVTNFTASRNSEFLKNKSAQEAAIINIVTQLDIHNANGVVIDFENVPREMSDELSSFIQDLSDELKDKNKKVCMTIPAIDVHGTYNAKLLEPEVEFFLLMGYDYFGSWSKEAGPIAPLHSQPLWGSYSVETSVDQYLSRGLNPKQLILVVPYYGGLWQVSDLKFPSKKIKFGKHVLYREARKKYLPQSQFDSISKSSFHNLKEKEEFYQIWFDGKEALSHKYDLINTDSLAGAGIWALGYDNGYTELWQLIEHKFGNIPLPDSLMSESNVDDKVGGYSFSPKEILADITLLKWFVGLIAIILISGLLLSLRRKEMRSILSSFSILSLVLMLLPIGISLYMILFSSHYAVGSWLLFGTLMGYGIYYLKENTKYRKSQRIP